MGYFDHLKKNDERPTLAVVPTVAPGEATGYANAALLREADAVSTAPEGTRNHALNRAAFNLGQLIASGHLNPDTTRDTLTHAARAAGLPDSEIDQTLNSGLGAGHAHPRAVPERPPLPEPTVLDPQLAAALTDPDGDEEVARIIRDKFPLLDWHDLWNTEDEDEEWIVEPILPARRLVALFSAPKVGKSLLMLEIAVAVARGQEVLGVTPDRPRRVLYVDFENDPRGDIRERLRAMGVRPNHLDNLCYLSYPTLAKLDTATGALELMAIVKEYGCEVVVIDTISRAVQGEENENDTWLAFYRNTGLAMKQAGVACIRLDHTGKDHDKGMRGGSAKYGDVDAVWKLTKVTEETFRLDCTDHRMRITEPTIVVTREQSPILRHKVEAEGRAAAWDAKVQELVRALDSLDVPNDAGRDMARKALKERGLRGSDASLNQAIKLRKQRLGYSSEEAEL